jgi:hypothetical protein
LLGHVFSSCVLRTWLFVSEHHLRLTWIFL